MNLPKLKTTFFVRKYVYQTLRFRNNKTLVMAQNAPEVIDLMTPPSVLRKVFQGRCWFSPTKEKFIK